MKRRDWLQKSILSSSSLLVAPYLINGNSSDIFEDEILRLHWNENPFGPSKNVVKAVQEAVYQSNLYWDEKNLELRKKLAEIHQLNPNQYLITSGSTEILSLLGQHVGLMNGEIVMGEQSFPTIAMFGSRCGAKITKVPMAEDYLDLNAMSSAIGPETKLVFICNPNNPTSTELDRSELVSFCKAVPSDVLICVDEAYIEFSKKGISGSLVNLVPELPNLVIARTFSKAYGLAGFRLGYAISQSQNIDALRNRYPALGMAPGLLPFVAGISATDDQKFVTEVVDNTNAGKSIMYMAFDEWGVNYAQSSTNFIYVQNNAFVKDIKAQLAEKGIWITQWSSMKNHIRISVGKQEWMSKLAEEMKKLRT
jgi:histidinol-phosphate aminotransferase